VSIPQGHVLAGTLTTPPGSGPFPAAVLITGLPPNNRNEGEPPWMPLPDLADALTRNGIAVLRVDDRGVNQDVTVRLFPGVSHSLLQDPIGLASGWVLLPAFQVSPEILRGASEWLAARLSRSPEAAHRARWPRISHPDPAGDDERKASWNNRTVPVV
jgi:hypothetical protein